MFSWASSSCPTHTLGRPKCFNGNEPIAPPLAIRPQIAGRFGLPITDNVERMTCVDIRPVTPADAATWERLRAAHWPDGAADHGPEIAAFFAGMASEPQAVFHAECSGRAIAVMERLLVSPATSPDHHPRTLLIASKASSGE